MTLQRSRGHKRPSLPEQRLHSVSSALPVPAGSIAGNTIQLEVSGAIAFDERSGQQSHERNGQQLSQRPPREDVIQRGHL